MYKALADAIIDVSRVFSRDDFRFGSGPFQLWKGEQSAIGEVVTITNKGGHLCSMGYAEFCDEWTTKPSFRGWFERIESDLKRLLTPEGRGQVQRLSDLTDALREMVLVLRPPTSGKAASHVSLDVSHHLRDSDF
jgi:hypothetical protein